MSNRFLLLGGFLTSFSYLTYKIWDNYTATKNFDSDENYLILKRMDELFHAGHLQNVPFPMYLEVSSRLATTSAGGSSTTLCQSVEMQLKRDWNYFLKAFSEILIK